MIRIGYALTLPVVAAMVLPGRLNMPGRLNIAAPVSCTTATLACTEWVTMAGGPGRTLVYRTYALDSRNEAITRAFILVHGAGRDAHNYFRHALAAAFLAGALENTIVISPRFAANEGGSCRDTLAANEINWSSCSGETWRSGSGAISNRQVTSFDVADEILRKLARRESFPNLRSIVIAGHSAGGQYVNRYEIANQIHDRLGVPITYVVANPSSYAYPDSLRPRSSAFPQNVAALPPGYIPPPLANPPPPFGRYGDSEDCTTYDTWPYGLRNRTGYTAKQSVEQLRRQLAARPTTYLVGELDILPLYGFDTSCPAMAQGPTRLARGLAFGRYVNDNFGARHTTLVVPACGHSARCMFTSDVVLAVIFPR
ncbi:MAG: alpha/beta fold hydrolase [Gemmatimonadota bacterium]|nr:alpha/beta fold hydrolase [Gemmatimonadota bacterium]